MNRKQYIHLSYTAVLALLIFVFYYFLKVPCFVDVSKGVRANVKVVRLKGIAMMGIKLYWQPPKAA